MIELNAGDYRLRADPERGGSIASFEWRANSLFRETCGPGILDTACFALVPFSNRIAFGRFDSAQGPVALKPNFPGGGHPHTLHGFGWLSSWSVHDLSDHSVRLHHSGNVPEWPWHYEAEQYLELTAQGLRHQISVTNLSREPMPAGLGLHPYFPRGSGAIYRGLHSGEWDTGADGLPLSLDQRAAPVDWWDGMAVDGRTLDTVYSGRSGPLEIEWPGDGVKLTITPDPLLSYTVVYTPAGADFFCVEPVSHATDAANRDNHGDMHVLAPGKTLSAAVSYAAQETG